MLAARHGLGHQQLPVSPTRVIAETPRSVILKISQDCSVWISLERTASHLNLWEEAAVVTALSSFAAIALAKRWSSLPQRDVHA